jgi:adenine-specific DNA methylase
MRALLLATYLPSGTDERDFWELFESADSPLQGLAVLDPFMGGGSTLVEASRLGADVFGSDVDPLAVEICKFELEPGDTEGILTAGAELLSHLKDELGFLYPTEMGETPLHYFSIARVICPACGHEGPLYRDLILTRDRQKAGAVLRREALTVFCPEDFSLHHLSNPDRRRLHCCGSYFDITAGTFRGSSYNCPNCDVQSSHRDLQTGSAPRQQLGVEVIPRAGPRHVRELTPADLRALEEAERLWGTRKKEYPGLASQLDGARTDDRPLSYGIHQVRDLYYPRQLLVLSSALDWISSRDLADDVRRGLRLALSNALATNNRLCGYATDYGRLAPLFSVRGYSLPALSVELNPLQENGGRGTIAACIQRVVRSTRGGCRRRAWDYSSEKVRQFQFIRRPSHREMGLSCVSAENIDSVVPREVDLCVFDPPYFDYIPYSELSAFHRAWFPDMRLGGDSLFPQGEAPVHDFGSRLGTVLRAVQRLTTRRHPLVFTFHSVNPAAWESLSSALSDAGLRITALWPVRSDGHMGHHSDEGNCEWDLVFAVRPQHTSLSAAPAPSLDELLSLIRPLGVSDADKESMRMACEVVRGRFSKIEEA